jgi:hypothetical protein
VIVDQINIEGIPVFETENQTAISRNGNAPKALEIAFQRMQPPTRICLHFFDFRSDIERCQESPKLRDLIGRQTAFFVSLKKPG